MKVFGIGLHKTGLTTLRECFEILGLNVCPLDEAYEIRERVARGERFLAMELAAKYEAFADSPWNYHFMWQLLQGVFPGSDSALAGDEPAWKGLLQYGFELLPKAVSRRDRY